jgi:hypothetical protein
MRFFKGAGAVKSADRNSSVCSLKTDEPHHHILSN